MIPNRDLDMLIAEKVMDLKNVHWNDHVIDEEGSEHIGGMYRNALVYQPYDDCPLLFVEVPLYSEDIGAAWEIVDKLKSEGHDFVIASYQQDELAHMNWYVRINSKPDLYSIAQGDDLSAPLAICKCALQACTTFIK